MHPQFIMGLMKLKSGRPWKMIILTVLSTHEPVAHEAEPLGARA